MSLSFSKRIPHNKKNERPSRVIFYDVESHVDYKNVKHQTFTPFLWTAIYKQYRGKDQTHTMVEHFGQDVTNFWDIVESYTYPKTKLYVVSHHLEVDFMPLQGFKELQERGWNLDKLISHGRVLTLYWKKKDMKMVIMNNGNLFDGSIEQWGNTFGVPKLTMPDDKASMEQWYKYCMRDTYIVSLMWDNLLEFMDLHDLGNFRVTKASLALGAFRHRFMWKDIAIHNNPQAIVLERLSYKGGRFEALKVGDFIDTKFYNLDINSMYGYIESAYELPYELRGIKDSMQMDELLKRLGKYAVVAQVNVTISKPYLPHIVNEKIVYTPGTFDTVLTTPELLYVIEHDKINDIGMVAWYYKAKILRDYADYFLQLKTDYDQAGNLPMRQVVKLYLNSLYGKFGQHGYEESVIGECDPSEFKFVQSYNADTHTTYDIAFYGGKVHKTITTLSGDNSFTAIASHITAYGRLLLWSLIDMAGYENVYHVATDSLVVNEEGNTRLQSIIDRYKPGMLKLEATFDNFIIKDVNDTIQGEKVKCKGIPKNAVKVGEDEYIITEWPRLVSLIKQGIYDAYYTRVKKKHLHRRRYHEAKGDIMKEVQTDLYGSVI